MPRWFVPVFVALCLASFAVTASGFPPLGAPDPARSCHGSDLFNYYYAARGALEGLSPYDRTAIIDRFGNPIHFVYPLYALPAFLPLALFDFATARAIYLLAQLAALAGIIAIAHRSLRIDWRWLSLLLPAGFGATTLHDLCSGNTVIFESFFLWLAIAMLWRRRADGFALALFLAALPKLLWLMLLPLLLHRSVVAWRSFFTAAIGVLLVWTIWFATSSDTLWRWLSNVRATTGFRTNVFTILRWFDEAWGGTVGGPLLQRWETWGYGLWIALVGAVFALALRRGVGFRTLSLFAPLSLLAVWPGNGVYSYVPLLPIAAALIFFLAGRGHPLAALTLTVLCLLPEQVFFLPDTGLPFFHATTLVVLVFWASFAVLILRQPQAFDTRPSAA
jgi:hypothetical protein